MDIKIFFVGKLERQIANHLEQIQDKQKQRKIEHTKTTKNKKVPYTSKELIAALDYGIEFNSLSNNSHYY